MTESFHLNPSGSHNIFDTDMDVANWRRYGNLVKTNKTVRDIQLGYSIFNEIDEINPEAVHCIEAFFEGLKDNTTIESIYLAIDFGTTIPPLAVRHFFQNNKSLKSVKLCSSPIHSVSPEQSRHLSTALRDIPLKKLHISCSFINNGSVEQILSACRKVKQLWMCSPGTPFANFMYTSLAEAIRDPTTKWRELSVNCVNPNHNRNLDVQRAENDIISSLAQNAELKTLKLHGLFERSASVKRFASLLCNTTSIESILQSNHTLENIEVIKTRALRKYCQQYLEINKTRDKRKVAQIKVMRYYLRRKFEASPLPSMPLAVLPRVLGIDVPKRYKCTAVFNILKGIPELCNVSSRNLDQLEEITDAAHSEKKRQKTGA